MSGKQKHYHQQAPSSFPEPELQTADTVFSFGEEEPVIKDDVNEQTQEAYSAPEGTSAQKYWSESSQRFVPDDEGPGLSTDAPENKLTGFEGFYEEQKERHRGMYFFFGLVILTVFLLGIFSAVFLALTALKDIKLPF